MIKTIEFTDYLAQKWHWHKNAQFWRLRYKCRYVKMRFTRKRCSACIGMISFRELMPFFIVYAYTNNRACSLADQMRVAYTVLQRKYWCYATSLLHSTTEFNLAFSLTKINENIILGNLSFRKLGSLLLKYHTMVYIR